MRDVFADKDLSPMLLYRVDPFDDDNYIYELKLDGIRCVAYLDRNEVVLKNKRNKDVTDIYPELGEIYKCSKKRCILDGELVCLGADSKPDFFAVQKRSLMTDKCKIALSLKRSPVQFVAFDILYLDGQLLTDKPLMERKKLLSENVSDGSNLSISRFIEGKGKAFFELAKDQGLEGVVAKKKDGKYYAGKRSREWLKIKVMQDEDLLVCGYKMNEFNKVKDLLMATYVNGKLAYRGSVSLGISKEDEKKVLDYAMTNTIKRPWFSELQNVVWLKLALVGNVQYMSQTDNGRMRQPVWKGLRDDSCH